MASSGPTHPSALPEELSNPKPAYEIYHQKKCGGTEGIAF